MTILETSPLDQLPGETTPLNTSEHLGAVAIEAAQNYQPTEDDGVATDETKKARYYNENYTQDNDIDFMSRAIGGDEEAIDRLLAHWLPIATKIAYRKTSSPTIAEEISSEAMRRSLKRIHTLEDTSKGFAPWITTVVQNLIIDYYRSSARARKHIVYEDETGVRDSEPNPDKRDLAEQAVSQIAQIKALKDLQKMMIAQGRGHQFDLIADRYLVGLSTTEVAKKMEVSEEIVKSRVYRARIYALGLLKKMGYSEEIILQ